MVLGRSGRQFGELGARLDGYLGGPRAGLDAPGDVSGAVLEDLGVPNGSGKAFFGSKVEKCKLAKSLFFQCVFDDFGGSGLLKINQNGVKWRSKWIKN